MGAGKHQVYSFKAKMWKYDGPAGWYFITLPKMLAVKIRKKHGLSEEGWGRLKASAKIGKTEWKTAIWFDTKAKSYLLPVKAVVRKSEALKVDTRLSVVLEIESEDPKLARWVRSTFR